MKHGDKTKTRTKPAKASKGSRKRTRETPKGKVSVRLKTSQTVPKKGSAKVETGKKVAQRKTETRKPEAPKAESGSGKAGAKPGARPEAERNGFTNPVVAAAFKRAIKKYSNTFRRLTD